MQRYIITTICILFAIQISFSQNKIGDWQEHFSGKNAQDLCADEEYIHVACEQMLYRYDYTDIDKKYTKINGLSDTDLKFVRQLAGKNSYIIVYKNSNIDVLQNGEITNFAALKNKQISGDKTVYDITVRDNKVWLSCGFGIVTFDTEKMEFDETYYIGEQGSFVKVFNIDFSDEYLYAASSEGLKRASLAIGDFYDFKNWELVTLPENKTSNAVKIFNGTIYVNLYSEEDKNTGRLYYNNGNGWQIFNENYTQIKRISTSENFISFITHTGEVYVHNKTGQLWRGYNEYQGAMYGNKTNINQIVESPYGDIFLADGRYSLVKPLPDNSYEFISPEGPFINPVMQLRIYNNLLIGTAGGMNEILVPAKREAALFKYNLSNGNYTTIVKPGHRNFYSIASPDNGEKRLFIGSWNSGLYELSGSDLMNRFDETNSSLQSILPNYQSVRIGALHYDDNGNLFMINNSVGKPISVYTKNKQWFSFAHSERVANRQYVKMIRLSDGTFWACAARSNGGIYAFDTKNTPMNISDDRYKFFTPRTSNNKEKSSDVRCMAEDKDGNIWVGTGEGIFVYYYPDRVFETTPIAERIQLTSVDADTSEQYLLKTEMVTSITVDEANRKWIGTQNAGAFLVSPNGKEQILAFNTKNSPLVSNTINDIAIDPKNGRVFFASSKGLMSYRAEATKGSEYFENVYVFPNPVRPDYEGAITITGLMVNTNVKITDIAGNLVYETVSTGGQAIWQGKNMNGEKISTGVYLVFCSNSDGSETHITKLLFIK